MKTTTGVRSRLTTLLSARGVFVALLFGGIFALAARDVTDPDVWWHLKTGQWIVERHAVPRTDPFSFTRQGERWVTHEWLAEVLIYGLYRLDGRGREWAWPIVVFALLTTATLVFLYLRCAGQPYTAGLVVLWGAFVCRPTWGVRPQTLSMLLASFLLWLLDQRKERPGRLWWIVPLTLLWANLHAGYALGIALLALFLAGDWLDGVLGEGPTNAPPARTLAKVLVASLLVVAVNPSVLRLYLYPLETLSSPAMQSHIAEWFSPNFHQAEYAPFLLMLLGVIVVAARSPDALRPHDLLLVCFAALAALIAVRNIPIFVLVAVPLMARSASRGSRALGGMGGAGRLSPARAGLHLAILAGLAVFVCWQTTRVIGRQGAAEARHFPAGAASFILTGRPQGPIFNYYNWGGYLIWRLYPTYRVFIDGRADLYGDALMKQFTESYTLTGDWRAPLEQWRIQTVVIPVDCPLAAALQASPGWRVVFRDPLSLVLARTPGGQ